MTSKTSTFQIVLFVLFGGFFVIGFISFALYGSTKKGGEGSSIEKVVGFQIWGTLSKDTVEPIIRILSKEDFEKYSGIKYIQKDPKTFSSEFVNELAAGRGPDLVIIPHEEVLAQRDKLTYIQYSALPLSSYEDLFVPAANIFLTKDGALALPMLVDPLVLYYNIDIQEKNKIRILPETWEDVVSLSNIIEFDGLKVKTGLINLGGIQNNSNIKDIISLLLLQSKNSIAKLNKQDRVQVTIANNENKNNTEEVFDFYTSFANPKADNYTWDESIPEAQRFFTSDELFLYIGYASEYNEIRRSNPNLRFGVTEVPQLEKFPKEKNFSRVLGVAIPRSASKTNVSFEIAKQLTFKQKEFYKYNTFNIPTAVKNFKIDPDAPSRWKVFFDSAFVASNWHDVNKSKSTDLFKQYARGITNGQYSTRRAVSELDSSLRNISK